MAQMRPRGGTRRYRRRALSAVVLVALVTGAVAAAVWVPGAEGRPQPTAKGSAVRSLDVRSALSPRRPGLPAPAAVVVPASLAVPVAAASGSGPLTPPSTEAQVAADLIAVVDARSDGKYAIEPTADNVSLLETWMDNEGGLWADNPLNTSLDADRYPHQVTSSGQNTGIPVFPDIKIGIDATAQTLLSGHAYVGILWVLSEGTASCESFARAVMASPWAASHYGGNPAHFCGATGGSGTPGSTTTACLRVRNRGHSVRMPGQCGHRANGGGAGRGGHAGRHRAKETRGAVPAPAPAHHRNPGRRMGPAARAHGHAGPARSRR